MGKTSNLAISLTFLKSMHIWSVLSFLGTITIGLRQGQRDGTVIPSANIFRSSCCTFSHRWWGMGLHLSWIMVPFGILISCHTPRAHPGLSLNTSLNFITNLRNWPRCPPLSPGSSVSWPTGSILFCASPALAPSSSRSSSGLNIHPSGSHQAFNKFT